MAPNPPESLMTLRQAGFGYERTLVVSGVEHTVERGDFVGIVGPNGAGKTTLFRGMLGLIPPMRGTVERHTDALGYVPQRESLDAIYPLRVEEVVQMGAFGRLRGWRRLPAADRALALENLARVGMDHLAKSMFSHLSGGQRQRVLIARALMTHPDVLLLDEPTSGVDREAQADILALLTELNTEQGLAILLVSHQLDLLREAVHELLVVADGSVRVGSADQLGGGSPWMSDLHRAGD